MRFVLPVVRSFLSELEDLRAREMMGPLDLDGICRSQINLLRSIQAAHEALVPQGWKVIYDEESECLVFENPSVSGNQQSKVETYIRELLPKDAAEKLIDELRVS